MRPTRMTAAGPSARSLLSVILTEYVLPGSGTVKTSALLECLGAFDVTEPSARQAIRRLAHDGIIERDGPGQWRLTEAGRTRLVGLRGRQVALMNLNPKPWDGQWLLVRTTVPETQRGLRHELRRDLAARGFGALGQGWFIIADLGAEARAQEVLARLDLTETALTFTAHSGQVGTPEEIVRSAWNLEEVRKLYESVIDEFRPLRPTDDAGMFRAWTLFLQHTARAVATDPTLPRELLPPHWIADTMAGVVRDCYQRWRDPATRWWAEHESAG